MQLVSKGHAPPPTGPGQLVGRLKVAWSSHKSPRHIRTDKPNCISLNWLSQNNPINAVGRRFIQQELTAGRPLGKRYMATLICDNIGPGKHLFQHNVNLSNQRYESPSCLKMCWQCIELRLLWSHYWCVQTKSLWILYRPCWFFVMTWKHLLLLWSFLESLTCDQWILLTEGQWCRLLITFAVCLDRQVVTHAFQFRRYKTPWRSCGVTVMYVLIFSNPPVWADY